MSAFKIPSIPTFFKKISRFGENPIAADIAAKLHIKENDPRVNLINDILKQSGNNKAIAINAIMPDTFDDTSINYTDAQIDDAILLREQRNKVVKNSSFKTRTANLVSEYGANVFTSEVDKAQHYIHESGLIKQMEFVKRKFNEEGYNLAIDSYINNDYSDINDMLNGQFRYVNGNMKHVRTNAVLGEVRFKFLKKTIYYLKKLFYEIPPITNDVIVYRCWPYGLINYVDGQPYFYNQFLSTSLFKDFSKKWCQDADPLRGYFMRITIPAGSRVIPIIDYKNFSPHSPIETEYELLLNNFGSLINEGNVTYERTTTGAQMSLRHFRYIPPTEAFLDEKNDENIADAAMYDLLNGGRKSKKSKRKSIRKGIRKGKKVSRKNRKGKKKSKKYIY